jgi:hypothetical protein
MNEQTTSNNKPEITTIELKPSSMKQTSTDECVVISLECVDLDTEVSICTVVTLLSVVKDSNSTVDDSWFISSVVYDVVSSMVASVVGSIVVSVQLIKLLKFGISMRPHSVDKVDSVVELNDITQSVVTDSLLCGRISGHSLSLGYKQYQ